MAEANAPAKGKQASDASQHLTINVMTTMNVDAIIAAYGSLSTDPTKPTAIGHANIYMVSDDPRGWTTGNDPGNITLNAHVNDTLSFYCNSTSGNSDSAAFIYSLSGGGSVLNNPIVNVITLQGAAQPTSPNGYPFKFVPESFSRCDTLVASKGTAQNFWASAALFTVDDDNENQVLAGYVTWDPTVVVA
ncbi:inclusion body family protein [Cupriavidus basilensis]|uniref:Inclusion body family protein n=1 Tax=Cupriavidus basilensis TaxID=68895 RepID=A0ABT6AH09_9BURK|nr:inclusion body family protein [Cupriavidus basilensis]MDF3831873.1 inclusion body family protein [Cupriavidus basilensis]